MNFNLKHYLKIYLISQNYNDYSKFISIIKNNVKHSQAKFDKSRKEKLNALFQVKHKD